MTGMNEVGLSLVAITFIVALVLAIAWLDFGRPRHALTWSIAFWLLGMDWVLGFVAWSRDEPSLLLEFGVLSLGGVSIGLNTLGFRQRAGDDVSWRPVLIGIAAQIVATALVLWLSASPTAASLPLYTLSALMAWNASRLLVGRRKGERAAERMAQHGLRVIALLSLAMLATGALAAFGGLGPESLPGFGRFGPILPALITGIGLFTVFLLTADLADQSRRLAGTDILTGLLNRRGFEDAAQALLGSALRNDRRLCLAVIDIDRFKLVNDRFGHLAGDEVLRRFAARLTEHISRRDILARVGGEEFALLLADKDCAESEVLLNTARESIAACPLDLPDDYRVTASFGLTTLGTAYDLAGLFAEADQALYVAKTSGRNRVVVAG